MNADIFEALRSGLVPSGGLHRYAVGTDEVTAELDRALELVAQGTGAMRFLRGDFGAGKTFYARLTAERAMAAGWATSVAVVSENDLRLWRFDELYRRIVADLATSTSTRGALGDVVDRFFAGVADRAEKTGTATDGTPTAAALLAELRGRAGSELPLEMGRVLQAIWAAEQQGDFVQSSAWQTWLGGSANTSLVGRAQAAVAGTIGSGDAMAYLRGVVAMLRGGGYRGLVVVIDESETLLRQRADVRGRALNALRQLADMAPSVPGLMWLVTGTGEFFDSPRGVAGLQPLHDRIGLLRAADGTVSLRQPQISLRPLDGAQMLAVARRLRDLYPTQHATFAAKLSDDALEGLVKELAADPAVGVGNPRAYLRALVGAFDRLDAGPGKP